jgi:RPA family protein
MNKRWIAYKLNVKDIVDGRYTDDGFIEHGDMQVNRVRLMGTVVQKFLAEDKRYGFFVIDDGTDTIRIRSFQDSFELIQNAEIGDIADVFGRIRKYEEEIYIIPEIVRKITDPNLWVLRKIELQKQQEKLAPKAETPKEEKRTTIKIKETIIEEEVIEEVIDNAPKPQAKGTDNLNPRQKVISCIAKFDKGEGVDLEQLGKICGMDESIVDNVLTDLMNEGEIFEPRAGKVKILG